MIKIIHPVAGTVAILTIATFWLSTALSELFASPATVITVKTAIPWVTPGSRSGRGQEAQAARF